MKTLAVGVTAAALLIGIPAYLGAQDAPKVGDQPKPPPPPPMAEELTFEKMDANGDGKVTLEEFQAAWADVMKKRFQKMDANGDGAVTKEEMEKARTAFRGAGRGPRAGGGLRHHEAQGQAGEQK